MEVKMTLFEMKEKMAELSAAIQADCDWIAEKAADPNTDEAALDAKKAHRDSTKKRFDLLKEQHDALEAQQKAAVEKAASMSKKDDIIAKKAAFYRAVLTGDKAGAAKAYSALGAIPGANADLGYGDSLLPTNTSRELITEPVETNSLRQVEPCTNITGLEEPRLLFEIDDADLADVTDLQTANEIAVRGENVVYGRYKTKVKVSIMETVLHGTDVELVSAVEDALRGALAIKEKMRAFAPASGSGAYDSAHAHMSFYNAPSGTSAIKEVEGDSLIQAIINAWADLPDIFAANAVCVMRKQDYYAAIKELNGAGNDLWGKKPEDVLGIPTIWNDRAVVPVIGDFKYAKQNYEAGTIFDTDKDVDSGKYKFVLTAWGDHQIRLFSAFRLAKVNP
jgi:HK97 family phage major capsid protein